MKIRSLRFSLLTVSLGALALTGCRTVPLNESGDMAAVYQFGEFRMLLNTHLPTAVKATQTALQQLDLYKTSETVETYNARIVGRARNDQKITVILAEVNSRQTLLRIRWGEGGNQANSRVLYEAIERAVGKP